MLHLAAWGQCFADFAAQEATIQITDELSDRPDLISACILDTLLLNFIISSGFAMLHASCLAQDDGIILLLGGHNARKSTAALNLVLAGCALVSDSMVFLTPGSPYFF